MSKNTLYKIDETLPEKSDEHILHLNNQVDKTFDENYQFIPKNSFVKFCRAVLWKIAAFLLGIITYLMHGTKIKNKQITKELLRKKQGYISISNHCLVLDCYCAAKASHRKKIYLPTVEETLRIPVIRHVISALNVIPIPSNPKGLIKFKNSVNELLQSGNRVHFYPEGALWPYYKELREFKPGAFRFAVENNVPIVPICLYFRPRKGLWKILGKKPLITIEILAPIYPDSLLPKKQAIHELLSMCYDVMKNVIDSHLGDTPDTFVTPVADEENTTAN